MDCCLEQLDDTSHYLSEGFESLLSVCPNMTSLAVHYFDINDDMLIIVGNNCKCLTKFVIDEGGQDNVTDIGYSFMSLCVCM